MADMLLSLKMATLITWSLWTTIEQESIMEKIDLICPGEILLEEFLKPNHISQTKFAGDLDIPVSRINEIVKGQRSITPDTAIRFAEYFDTTVNFWLNLQNDFDIEKAKRTGEYDQIIAHIRKRTA
jgi:addiction module HigA family antidote